MGKTCFYQLFGLRVRSALRLDELAAAAEVGAADVEISCGTLEAPKDAVPGYNVTPAGTLLSIPQVGRYLIREGREIVVDPEPGASDRNLRVFLLGSAFGALLHQRGLLPLHANAIEIGGRAVAFSGHSGAGKSTIAGWFQDRGLRMLSDDVCVIGGGDGEGPPLAFPGVPRLRLWRDALEESGRAAEDYPRSFDDRDKYDVPAAPGSGEVAMPLPLERIYILARAEEEDEGPAIRRLSGVEAVDALVANTYRGGYVKMIGGTGAHLAQCLRIARSVPVFEARRVWGFVSFDRQAAMLEEHARSGA